MVGPRQPATHWSPAAALFGAAAFLSYSGATYAGSARDYLNAPVDAWMVTYNAGYVTSVTPEDGTDISSRTASNVLLQAVALTRTVDFWGRTGGLSINLPFAVATTNASTFQASTNGFSDIAFLAQINIFGGPELTREQFSSFVPQTFSSFHLYIGTPLGTNDPTSPIERKPLDDRADRQLQLHAGPWPNLGRDVLYRPVFH
jgi:hypothetical protein